MTRLLVAVLSIAFAGGAEAAELLMFEQAGCGYCRRWDADIGPGYPKTKEGKLAPLRRLDIKAKLPDDLKLKRPVTITPTFVLIEAGEEVGRLVGYGGSEFFYEMLGGVMAKLPSVTSTARSTDEPGKSTP